MTSIITNFASMAALQTLRSIDQELTSTQAHISSGYRIEKASDNAAYWSIATTMRSDSDALATVSDALGLGAAKTDTAYAGLSQSLEVITAIRNKMLAAREPSVDRDKVNREISELKNQLTTISQTASFSGEAWLYNTSTTAAGVKEMVGSIRRTASGSVTVDTIDFDTSKSVLIDTKNATRGLLTKGVGVTQPSGTTTSTATYYLMGPAAGAVTAAGSEIVLSSSTTNDALEGMLIAVDAILKSVTDVAGTLGAVNSRISSQGQFVKTMKETIDKGVSRLIDTDMNEESTRLKALQTQQQLGIQALSIANNAAQNILQLFR